MFPREVHVETRGRVGLYFGKMWFFFVLGRQRAGDEPTEGRGQHGAVLTRSEGVFVRVCSAHLLEDFGPASLGVVFFL